jgi:hypothetical protein
VSPIVHIQLGRSGDLLILLPCWWKLWQDTGQKPVVVVCREFAPVLRGASYVEADIINGHWYASIQQAAQMARLKYGQAVITQCHGVGHDTDQTKYATFGEAMWSQAGFPGRYGEFPLVIDRRNRDREDWLIRHVRKQPHKPMLLYNFLGMSSPLPCSQQVHNRLRRYVRAFELVNLAGVRAERIYDLLGLFDIAAGLITIDTATLHLAAASDVPMLAYCRGGWSSAIPKPGAIRVPYEQAHTRLDAVDEFLQSLKTAHAKTA